MKKILTALLLILLVGCNLVLSACSLVTINNTKYLAQTVAKVDDIKISMEDLILGYNSFGYSYIQNNGMTNEEAVKKTLEDLIDRELLFKKAKELIGNLSITYQNEVWQEVYDAINASVKEYADDIIESEGLNLPETEESTEETNSFEIKEYEKKVARIKNPDGSYQYIRVPTEPKKEETTLIEFVLDEYGIEGLADRAFSKYINNTKKSREEYKKLTTQEIFEKEKERIYKIYEKNKYISLFQEIYERNAEINVEGVVEKYKELVRSSAFTYYLNESNYNSKMQSTSNEVYYQPFGEKFIQVAHILIKYSADQEKEINQLKTDLNQGYIDIEEYNHRVKTLASSITTQERVNGEKIGEVKSVNDVYNEISQKLQGKSNSEKLATFIDYIEKYNEDEGMISAINSQTQYYSINLDTNVADTMVKPFADASRAMYSKDGSKDYTMYFEPVLTDYGYHIIFSLGVVENDFNINNINNITASYLYETEAMEGTNKSLFDKMFELVDYSGYQEYQSALVSGLRSGKTITYYESAYKSLYE